MLRESDLQAMFESNNDLDSRNPNNNSNAYTPTTNMQPVFLKKDENIPYQPVYQYQRNSAIPSHLDFLDNDINSQGSMVPSEKEFEIQTFPYQRSNALLQNEYGNPNTSTEYNEYNESFYSASTLAPVAPTTTFNVFPSTTTIIQQEVQEVAPTTRRRRVSKRSRDTITLGGITIGWVLFVGLLIVFGPFVLIPLFPLIPFFFIWWGARDEHKNVNTTSTTEEYIEY